MPRSDDGSLGGSTPLGSRVLFMGFGGNWETWFFWAGKTFLPAGLPERFFRNLCRVIKILKKIKVSLKLFCKNLAKNKQNLLKILIFERIFDKKFEMITNFPTHFYRQIVAYLNLSRLVLREIWIPAIIGGWLKLL